jgi:PST family polysaccharide transporter
MVPRALLIKRMGFGELARVDVAASVGSGCASLALAAAGFGVWALVASNLGGLAISTLLVFVMEPWSPRGRLRLGSVRGMIRYGGWLTAFGALNYWLRNADNVLIGRLIGEAALGFYNRAYMLMLLPISQVIPVLGNVMLSTLSSVQDDPRRMAAIYRRATGAIAIVAFPIMIGLAAVAEPLVLALFGEKWRGMIQVLRILGPVGLIQSIVNPTGWIYTALGKSDTLFRWTTGLGIIVVGALAIGASFGTIEAVAWAYLLINVVMLPIDLWVPCRLVNLSLREIAGALVGPLGASLAMGAAVTAIGRGLGGRVPAGVALTIEVTAGAAIYLSIAHLTKLAAYVDELGLLRERRGRPQ